MSFNIKKNLSKTEKEKRIGKGKCTNKNCVTVTKVKSIEYLTWNLLFSVYFVFYVYKNMTSRSPKNIKNCVSVCVCCVCSFVSY